MGGDGGARRAGMGRKAVPLVLVVLFMGAMAWAAVPLYNLFCRVTGYAGTPQVADAPAGQVLDRTILVRFDATVAPGMPWEFRPKQNVMRVRVGETAIAYYEARNPTGRAMTATTTYNVAPFTMGAYFDKIQCFCFTEQKLGPGESVEMPVTFYIDPAMVEDPDTMPVKTVTLSYTMYPVDAEEHAARALRVSAE